MEILFADDSTQKGAREGMGSVISIGGVLVPDSSIRPLTAAIDSILEKYGVPKGEEFKWSPKKGSWIYTNLHGDNRNNCYIEILKAAKEANVRCIVICWDTGRTYLSGDKAFEKCVDYLFERATVHLEKSNSFAIMIADRPGGGRDQEEQFLSDFVTRIQDGTDYVVPDRILLNVLTTPSHLVRHLQLADLITGVTTAMVSGNHKYAKPIFEHVKPLFIKNYMETVGGTGLKIFPDELVNLYHWVLEETMYAKVRYLAGTGLPDSSAPYCTDEFKIHL